MPAERRKKDTAKSLHATLVSVLGGQLETATGTKANVLQLGLIEQIHSTLWLPGQMGKERKLERLQAAIALLEGIRPQDEIESMLAVQMVATHHGALECLRRAMIPEQSFACREQSLKHGAKLMAIYVQQLAALDKRRGKGQQKVTVEYVNVESGGQAIVGHVEQGRAPATARRRSGSRPKRLDIAVDQEVDKVTPAKAYVPARIEHGED